ncbi:hypothetical protein LTS15_009266 [Exophiala xenobiotica]|nr:hypothetical protein LTS15_009266 [Exophiala xenobiotica]
MSTPLLPSYRRQQLVLDFSSLKDNCPEGIYLSLTPGNPSLWAAVLFVREGPYAGAVLRFDISFPNSYPEDPPLVTFSSDIFHPLVVPLTTYTFSASILDASSTISASDTGRLPPGAFSLRYGFRNWFRRRSLATDDGVHSGGVTEEDDTTALAPGAPDGASSTAPPQVDEILDRKSLLLKMLSHIKSTFEDIDILDSIPLDVAGDPSAWHAWRAHRGLSKKDARAKSPTTGSDGVPSSPKYPSEWKWDGVWESRVTNGIEASINEATLFGSATGGRAGRASVDLTTTDARQKMAANATRHIRFSKLDEELFDKVRSEISSMAM